MGYICKEYIGKKLKNEYNVELIAKSRKNMKNKQYNNTLSEEDKKLLKEIKKKKRTIIETVM